MNLLLLASFSGDAHAFNHTGWMWDTDQLPIVFYVTDYLEDSLPQTVNESGRRFQEEVQIKNLCNWHWTEYCESLAPGVDGGMDDRYIVHDDADCADIRFEYGGVDAGNEGEGSDGMTKVYFDDPKDRHDTGVLAVTVTVPGSAVVKTVNGLRIERVSGSDVVYNNDVSWGTDWDIAAGCNGSVYSMEGVGTHEFGHLLGMAHSCEQGEICVDNDDLEATMYWTGGPCDTEPSSINSDDIAGIQALYGQYVSWEITEETEQFGPAPLDACFNLLADDSTVAEIQSTSWDFGDGESSTDAEPCHTYNTEGQFTVTLDVEGESDTCGVWTASDRQRAVFLVCDIPRPSFEVAHYDGLTYQLVNQTDVSTYGCVDGIRWEIYKGNSASGDPVQTVEAWSPKIEFPSEGAYTIVLTAQGPAGEDVTELKYDAVDQRGEGTGCSSSSSKAALSGGLLGLLGLMFVRRRD